MKRSFILPMLVAIAGVVLALGASAFRSEPKEETKAEPKTTKPVSMYFRFIGDSPSDYYLESQWEISGSPYDDCGDTDLTCTVSSTSFTTKGQLVSYLNNSGNPRNPQVGDGTTYQIESKRASF